MDDMMPPPPLPPDIDLSGMEPPWETFVDMLLEANPTLSTERATALVEEERRQWRMEKAANDR